MYPTIIFGIALLFSTITIITICEYIMDRKLYIENTKYEETLEKTIDTLVILVILTVIFWSWLYYLSH